MIDILIAKTSTSLGDTLDLSVLEEDLATEAGLETAVIISLFTDRRVEIGELPDGVSGQRGWWGDMFAEVFDDEIGSKLWLLNYEKELPETLAKAEEWTRDALQWMLDDGIASDIDVSTEWSADSFLKINISITKPDGSAPVNYNFDYAWTGQAGLGNG